jgi:hypothetical protein
MSVVGALIEIPTMLSLVKMAEFFKARLYEGEERKTPRELAAAAGAGGSGNKIEGAPLSEVELKA